MEVEAWHQRKFASARAEAWRRRSANNDGFEYSTIGGEEEAFNLADSLEWKMTWKSCQTDLRSREDVGGP